MTSPVTLSVASALAYAQTSSSPIAVSDYGINIGNNADALAALGKQLVSVQDTSDTPPFPWYISVADVLALAPKMFDSTGKLETFNAINDTLANVTANAAKLLALGPQIVAGGIQVNDTAANITAKATVLATLGTDVAITINDTAANVATYVNQLLAMGTQQIGAGAINVTDTTANVVANATALTKLGAELAIWINDTTANVVNNETKLLALAPQLSAGGISISDSVANIVANSAALIQMPASLNVSVTATDTLAHINANMPKLLALGNELGGFLLKNNASISILSTDGKSVTMDMPDALIFFKQGLNAPIKVADDGSNLNLNTLVAMGNQLLSVQDTTVGDNPFSSAITVAQLLALAPKMTDALGNAETFNNITDTVANINANQANLLSLGAALGGFSLPDGTTISILSANGKSVTLDSADAVSFVNEKLTAPIHVTDLGSNLNLSALAAMGSQLLSVQDTTVGDNPFSSAITVAQLLALAPKMTDASGNIETFGNITDTAANIAVNASKLLALGVQIPAGSINIADSSTNINANQANLLSLGAALGGFNLPDGTTISILSSDGKSLTMDSADAVSFVNEKLAAPIHVTDLGSNLNLSALAAMGSQLLSVQDTTVGDNPFSSTITVAQLLALAPKMTDASGNTETFNNITDSVANINAYQAKWLPLGNVIGGFSLPDGTTISILSSDGKSLTMDSADAVSFVNEKLAAPIRVADSGGIMNLSALAAMGSQLLSVQDTTVGDNPFSSAITVAQLLALAPKMTDSLGNTETFNYITDTLANVATNTAKLLALGTQVAAGGILITDTLANIVNNSATLSGLGNKLSLTVTDTAVNVQAKLDYLQGISGQISSIFLTDATTPNLSLTAAQLSNDLTILNTISSNYTFTVSGVSAANAVSALTTLLGSQHIKPSSIAITDTAANLSLKLDTLQANTTKITSITLTDPSIPTLAISTAQLTNDTSILAKISGTYNLSVSGVSAANLTAVLSNSHVQAVALSDTASNVTKVLDTLQANLTKISGITLTDGGTPTLTVSTTQWANDAGIFAKISSAYNLNVSGVTVGNLTNMLSNPHVQSVTVSDSSSNIVAALNTLQTAASKISGITLTDGGTPTLAISATQWGNDAGILAKISSAFNLSVSGVTVANLTSVLANNHVVSIAVSDTASNIAAALDTLQADSAKISSITLTDGGTPTLVISPQQAANDAGILAKITSAYTLSGSGGVTVANLTAALANSHGQPVAVADTGGNIAAALNTLQADAAKISGITLTDANPPTLSITAQQLTSDAGALGLISGAYKLSISGVNTSNLSTVLVNSHAVLPVAVSDTASGVAAALSTLQADASKISGITLTDGGTPTLAVSATQLTNDAGALSLIGGIYNLTVSGLAINNLANVLGNPHIQSVTLSDTASNIAAALNTLQADTAKISGITLTDGGTPTLSITAQQLTGDAGALGLIGGTYSLSVSGINTSNLPAVLANPHVVLPVAVSDTASNIAAALNTLQADAAKISGITLTDGGTPTLSITAQQLIGVAGALGLITSTYNLIVNGVTVANLSGVLTNPHVQSVVISDTASNIAAALDTLQSDAAKISGITLTDGGTPTLTVSATQLASDTGVLSLITSTYNLTVSGINTGNLSSVLGNPHVQSVVVSDTASNIAAALDTLQSDAAKISSITLTDGSTPTLALSATQLANDTTILAKISGSYNLSVGGAVTVASLTGVLGNNHVVLLPVAIADNASNVALSLDVLTSHATTITSITLTDGGTPTLAITALQLSNDNNLLSKIASAYSLSVSGVSTANLTSVLSNNHVSSCSVSDKASNIAALLDTLQSDVAKISSITLTNTGTPSLAISATQLTNDANALAFIKGNYGLSVKGVNAANLVLVLANSHVLQIAVTDTASNVVTILDNLQSHSSKISSITLTDSGTPTLTITALQLTNDAKILAKISGAYNVSVTGPVTVASLLNVSANSHILPVAVTDTASNVAAKMNTLQADFAKITGITLTDGGTPTLAITALQLSNDSNLLSKIASAYSLSVSGVATANLTSVLSNNHVSSCSLSDKANNIAAMLDTLQGDASKISGITLTNGNTPTLAVSTLQLTNDSNIMSKIVSHYNLSVSGVTTANLATVLANAHVASVALTDSANNVNAMLVTLQTDAAKISSITLTDGGTPTLTMSAAQLASDANLLAKISGTYDVSVTGAVTVASLGGILANSHVLPVAVADIASNVTSVLNTLQTDAAKITSISLTDSGTPTLTISAQQFANDTAALGKISTPYSLVINGETTVNVASDLKNSHVAKVNVLDTGANVTANLDSLQSNSAQIGSIALTDKGVATLAITASQFTRDAVTLGKITSPYNLTISGETVKNIATDAANSHVKAIAVADTAAHINAKLVSLENSLGKLSSITLTDTTTPTLTVTAPQTHNELGVLNAIASPYLLSLTDSVANINKAVLSGVHTHLIEIMPTSLLATLTEKTQITDLNLSLINLSGDSINEHSFNTTGTEIDIVASNGTIAHQLFFTDNTESQLQLLGTGTTVVNVL